MSRPHRKLCCRLEFWSDGHSTPSYYLQVLEFHQKQINDAIEEDDLDSDSDDDMVCQFRFGTKVEVNNIFRIL